MNKTVLTTLTMVICLVPSCFYWFNIPFTFSSPNDCTPSAAHQCILHQPQEQTSIPFGAAFGKFIKESQIADTDYQINTIVLDAGHGGKDPGCSGKKSKEKDIALGIALKLGQKLERNFPELHVIYTRDRDVFIPLHRRASIANDNDADLFISIHCNYIRGSSVTKGSETYVMGLHTAEENLAVAKRENEAILFEEDYENIYGIDPNSDEGHILYNFVQNTFLDQSLSFASKVEDQIAVHERRRSRGVKQAGFQVLRQTAMPSVLVETGFLSNSQEENYLLTHAGQQGVAESVFRAFQDYKHEVEDYSTSNREPIATYQTIPPPTTPAPKPYEIRPQQQVPQQQARVVHQQPTRTYAQNRTITQKPIVPVVVHEPTPTKREPITYKKEEKPRVARTNIDWENIKTTSSNVDEIPTNKTYTIKSSNSGQDFQGKTPIEFRVQITASPTLLHQRSGRWLELNKLNHWAEPVWEDNQHKYQIMSIQDFNTAESIRLKMREIGFFNAYVIAYKGIKQISVNEAVKLQGE